MQALGNEFGSSVTTPARPAAPPPPPPPAPGSSLGGWSRRRRRRQSSYYIPPPPPPTPPPPSCTYGDPRDLALVIDSSGSVGSSAFKKAVDTLADFIGYMCHEFECDGPQTRLAIITYGSQVKEVFNFHYSGSTHRSETQIINDIKTKTTYMNGFTGATATGPALEYCRDNIFQTRNGMRSNSKRQILVLTDGKSNKGIKPGIVATQLHDQMGVDIYALGIGSGVSIAELKSITKERSQNNLLYNLLFFDFYEFSQVSGLVKDDIDSSGMQCKAASKIFDKKK